MLLGTRANGIAVGEHDLGREQVVDRQAELASQVPYPTPEREPADAGCRDDSTRGREAMLAGSPVDLAPCAAAADANRARCGIDSDVLEQRQVDHNAVVDRPETGAVVSATADGQRELVRAGEADRLSDIARARDARDQRRPAVDH